MLGKSVGSYKITKELGQGGMGAVYLAEHTLMGKQAAVKVLLPQFCAVQEVVDRFFNEAKSASMIKHPGIVDIYDFGTQEDGSAFIVMELLEGEPLSDLLEREPRLASERVALLGQQMARALQAAHELGIVHRDLKPDNIFLEPDSAAVGGERPKILDFGIAKLGGDLSDSSVKTRTGAIMGTPIFMSPEQCTGAGDVDNRSDVYSLGCILYCMVCGRPPFVKPGAGALIAAHITEVPQALSALEPQVDSDLEAIIMSTLAKSPEERPQSMNALANALGNITGHNTARRGAKPRANTAELFGNEAASPADSRLAKTHASTTLGSSAVGGVSTTDASPSSKAGGVPKVALAAGGVLAAAAIAFFALKSGSSEKAAAAPAPAAAAAAAAPAPVVQAPIVEPEPAPTPDLEPTTMTIELTSEPSGATVYRRADGVKLGTTPYKDELARGRGELDLLLKYADHESVKVSVPLQENFSQSIVLAANAAPEPKRRASKTPRKTTSKVATPTVTPQPPPKVEVKPVEKPKPDGSKWGELAN